MWKVITVYDVSQYLQRMVMDGKRVKIYNYDGSLSFYYGDFKGKIIEDEYGYVQYWIENFRENLRIYLIKILSPTGKGSPFVETILERVKVPQRVYYYDGSYGDVQPTFFIKYFYCLGYICINNSPPPNFLRPEKIYYVLGHGLIEFNEDYRFEAKFIKDKNGYTIYIPTTKKEEQEIINKYGNVEKRLVVKSGNIEKEIYDLYPPSEISYELYIIPYGSCLNAEGQSICFVP